MIVVANTLTYTNLCLMHVRCGRETSLPRILKGDERVASDSDKHCGSIVVYACVCVCVWVYTVDDACINVVQCTKDVICRRVVSLCKCW